MLRSLRKPGFGAIYLAAIFLGLYQAFTIYVSSSFLAQFFENKGIDILYTTAALETLIIFICAPQLVRKFGAFRLLAGALILNIAALLSLAFSTNLTLTAISFIIYQTLPAVLLFFLDIFLEGAIKTEKITGRIRSNFFTIINIAFLCSPFLVGKIVATHSYPSVYILSAVYSLLMLCVVLWKFKYRPTHSFKEIDFADSVRKFHFRKGLVTVFTLNFLLQCFYALMVIYTPIYLNQTIGFTWSELGILFTIMLIPFVLFEAPLGRLFDKVHREREAIVAGFFLMAATTSAAFLIEQHSLIIWICILFFSRVGASFVEIGTEYSFFKRVNDRDAGFISVYRMTMPLSYIIAPLGAGVILGLLPIQYIFVAISAAMTLGLLVGFNLNKLPSKSL